MPLQLFVFILLLFFSTITGAEERVALVIGNANYKNIEVLPNAVNDAKDIAETLEDLGFKVMLKRNLDWKQMGIVLDQFSKKKNKDTIGLFYYAGHAVEIAGKNYLLPVDVVDISIKSPYIVRRESLNLDEVLMQMEFAEHKANIIILDACRNNPFQKYKVFVDAKGFADLKKPENFYIIYATTLGKKALEGKGKNGLLVKYLKRNMLIPYRDIRFIVEKTRDEVIKESESLAYKQVLSIYGSLSPPFCFKSCPLKPSLEKIPKPNAPKHPRPPVPPRSPFNTLDPKLEPEMVKVAGGVFNMGCDDANLLHDDNKKPIYLCDDDEKPRHQVTVAPFYMGKYEITFSQWDSCVKAKACPEKSDNEWGRGKRPVVNISWDDTQKFINWLRKTTGKAYRLPTEAEWEYVAQLGIKAKDYYPLENSIISKRANCDGCQSKWDNKSTAPVGSFPSYQGFYDIYGNVSEWVQDCFHKDYQQAPTNALEWKSDCVRNSRGEILGVLRGGSWYTPFRQVRASHRTPASRNKKRQKRFYGFRVAR